jgi:hypothetical protein
MFVYPIFTRIGGKIKCFYAQTAMIRWLTSHLHHKTKSPSSNDFVPVHLPDCFGGKYRNKKHIRAQQKTERGRPYTFSRLKSFPLQNSSILLDEFCRRYVSYFEEFAEKCFRINFSVYLPLFCYHKRKLGGIRMSSMKYFTIKEANACLPMIKEEITKLRGLTRLFNQQYRDLEKLKMKRKRVKLPKENNDQIFKMEAQLDFMEIEAKTYLDNIQNQGVLLKNIEPGLVDFPAMIDNEEVLLCWKMGEPSVMYYHDPYEGFAGRKKLSY